MNFGEHDPAQRKEVFISDEDITTPLIKKEGRSLEISDIEEDFYERVDAINQLIGNLMVLREVDGPSSENVDMLEKQIIGVKNELGGYLATVVKEGHNVALREDIEDVLQKISKAIGTIQ
ncbi:MAG: hypothetical protein LiPW30_517 [Parcubacteria group bacterium LiPW_30]|nr:MAG: hypothetical protein LiPW30_517 [Parcubacteria group bacterium LiPW_30]